MTNTKRAWVQDLLLLVILAAATYFRVVGMNWDADQHLHPDERFLTMVETALQVRKCALPDLPVEACPADQVRWLGLADYLDTGRSTLNPHNRGYGFFVYGDFPVILVRYVAELAWANRLRPGPSRGPAGLSPQRSADDRPDLRDREPAV